MRDHERRELLFGHEVFGKFKHLGGGLRVECGRMFVKQQELGTHERGHQQRERHAGRREQAHMGRHAVLKAEAEHLDELREVCRPVRTVAPARPGPAAAVGDGKVFQIIMPAAVPRIGS